MAFYPHQKIRSVLYTNQILLHSFLSKRKQELLLPQLPQQLGLELKIYYMSSKLHRHLKLLTFQLKQPFVWSCVGNQQYELLLKAAHFCILPLTTLALAFQLLLIRFLFFPNQQGKYP